MRLWSLHPMYLDSKGLVACWREGLLAQSVLLGKTKGYKNHPQLERFRPIASHYCGVSKLIAYLMELHTEANIWRGYSFDFDLIHISMECCTCSLSVTVGQLAYERDHLARKLKERGSVGRVPLPARSEDIVPHPLFCRTDGGIENWERETK